MDGGEPDGERGGDGEDQRDGVRAGLRGRDDPREGQVQVDHCGRLPQVQRDLRQVRVHRGGGQLQVGVGGIIQGRQSKVQCLVSVPTVAVDKTDGCTIFFPRSCLDSIRILTSKCSDMNVSFPSAEDEQDWVERAIPEQYVHTIVKEAVQTTVSDLYSLRVCC